MKENFENRGTMVLGIHHVQITIPVGREADARAFYVGILGLREIPRPSSLDGHGGFWLKAGDDDLHVGSEEGFDRRSTKGHVAYLVDDLAYWRRRLDEVPVEIKESVPLPGYDRFEFRDPFGNRVEMIQRVGEDVGK